MTILAVADLFFFSFFFLGRAIEGARYNSDQTLQTCFLYQEQRVCIPSIYYFAFSKHAQMLRSRSYNRTRLHYTYELSFFF